MKKFTLITAMLALVLVFGLALVSCDNGSTGGSGGSGGSGDLRLVVGLRNSYRVEFDVSGLTSTSGWSGNDFSLTIDGRDVAFASAFVHDYNRNISTVQLSFTSPVVTVGTSYQVRVVYSGNAAAPFTREARVTCRD
jgi:hypothetical protein